LLVLAFFEVLYQIVINPTTGGSPPLEEILPTCCCPDLP